MCIAISILKLILLLALAITAGEIRHRTREKQTDGEDIAEAPLPPPRPLRPYSETEKREIAAAKQLRFYATQAQKRRDSRRNGR